RPFYQGETAGLPGYLASYQPYVDGVTISGPYDSIGPGDTPSRRRIFQCAPSAADGGTGCATKILLRLARRAYRRPVTSADIQAPLSFYSERRADGQGFDEGIEIALERMLVSPEFLFRGEAEPSKGSQRSDRWGNYRINDFELA